MGHFRFLLAIARIISIPSFQVAGMLVVVAVQAQQLPITAVAGIIIVVVVAVVDGEQVQIGGGKFPRATATNPGVKLERLFAVAFFPLVSITPGFGDDLVQLVAVRRCGGSGRHGHLL